MARRSPPGPGPSRRPLDAAAGQLGSGQTAGKAAPGATLRAPRRPVSGRALEQTDPTGGSGRPTSPGRGLDIRRMELMKC